MAPNEYMKLSEFNICQLILIIQYKFGLTFKRLMIVCAIEVFPLPLDPANTMI